MPDNATSHRAAIVALLCDLYQDGFVWGGQIARTAIEQVADDIMDQMMGPGPTYGNPFVTWTVAT